MEKRRLPKYRLLKSILANNRDLILKEKGYPSNKEECEEENIGYSRGEDYYKSKSDDINKKADKNDK